MPALVLPRRACVLGSALLLALPAAAQPDGGALLRQLQPAPAPAQSRPATPDVLPAAPAQPDVPAAEALRVRVERVRIVGQTVFDEASLQALLADAVGRDLDLAAMQALCERIGRHYRRHGYLVAHAWLPPQQLRDGELRIEVVEGRYDAVQVRRAPGAPAADLPLAGVQPGRLVEAEALERALLLAADLAGVGVRATLQPGASVGTSDLVLDVAPTRRLGGSVEADTWGSRTTGRERVGASLAVASPAGRGDLLTLRALSSGEGLGYLRAAWQLPVGSDGLRVGAAASWMRYRLGEEFAVLEATGTAGITTLFAAWPLRRSRDANLNLQLAWDGKRLQDRLDAVGSVTDKRLSNLSLGLSGDSRDAGGAWGWSLSATHGQLRLDSAAARLADATGPQAAGHFARLGWTVLRQQQLAAATGLLASFSGQWADRNLDSAEKLPLGGIAAVRAYPQGEAASDRAQLVTLELRQRVAPGWQLAGFVDAGRGEASARPWSVAGPGRRHLAGAGVGLHWTPRPGWSVQVAWAHRIHGGPSRAEPDRHGRFWLQASAAF